MPSEFGHVKEVISGVGEESMVCSSPGAHDVGGPFQTQALKLKDNFLSGFESRELRLGLWCRGPRCLAFRDLLSHFPVRPSDLTDHRAETGAPTPILLLGIPVPLLGIDRPPRILKVVKSASFFFFFLKCFCLCCRRRCIP